jgi:TPR repeat protein
MKIYDNQRMASCAYTAIVNLKGNAIRLLDAAIQMASPGPTFMPHGLISALLLLACFRAHATYSGGDVMPAHSVDLLSTNWIIAVREALPQKYFEKGDLNFQEATNLLCKEAQHGNNAAQGLWGFVMLTRSGSPEEAKAGLRLLQDSADKGYVPAMLQLGLLSEGGKYVPKDYTQALYWFSKAAEKGNSEAELQIGGCYHYGLGTNRDFAASAKWYRRSAEHTNYVAMKSLGFLLMNGLGVPKDLEAAEYWLTRAAKEGNNRRAMFNLGAIYSNRFPDTNSLATAFHWFQQSAELGDPLGCHQLANFYFRGWGVAQTNLDSYRYWLSKAATLGATEAQYMMGAACRTGDGVAKDIQDSLAWYRKAAVKRHPRAFYDLALHYLEEKTNRASMAFAQDYMLRAAQGGHREAQFQCAMSGFRGDVGSPDVEGSKQWLPKAADNGWGRAEFALFQLYYSGGRPGPACPAYPKDRGEAVKWLRRAAGHEVLQAQSVLAVMLIRGTDEEQDKAEAEKLLRNAAEHGYAQAQNDLGFAIQNGDTSTMDLVEAAMWCMLAKFRTTDPNTLRRAEVNTATVLSHLTADQKLEAERRVKAFQPLPIVEVDPMQKDWEEIPGYEREDGSFGH